MSKKYKTSKKNRTNYIYYGDDGHKTVLTPSTEGVTGAIIETLHSLDDEEVDNNRRETSKHDSIFEVEDKTETIIDHGAAVEDMVFSSIEKEAVKKIVREALAELRPQQQELIQGLYLSERPMSQAEYAVKHGIEEKSVSQKARRAKKKLKEILEKV